MIAPHYRADIDGLRGIAVLLVVAFHAFPSVVTGGFVGVDIFFVVSGFLIGSILLQATQAGAFSYLEFYARRTRRIFPALIVVLAACGIAGWHLLLTAEYRQLGKHLAAGAGFISNLAHWQEVGYFDAAVETKPLVHLWSLGVEEQFYILFPPILLAMLRLRLNIRAAICLLWVLSFGANLYLTWADPSQAFYSPLPRLWELLTGCLLASLYLNPPAGLLAWCITQRKRGWLVNTVAVTGITLILLPALRLDRTSSFPGGWVLLPVLGAALLVGIGRHAGLNRSVLSHQWLVWVGLISYPLYLWHWPLLSFARVVEGRLPSVGMRLVLVAASIALAALTYRYIEKPVRFGRWRRHAVPVLCALMLVVAAAGGGVWYAGGVGFRPLAQKEQTLFGNALVDWSTRVGSLLPACPDDQQLVGRTKAICTVLNVEKTAAADKTDAPLMLLWGDSHVSVWTPVIVDIARERGWRLLVLGQAGCPPLLNIRRTDEAAEGCSPELAADVLASINRLRPQQVILIANWDIYLNGWISGGVLQKATHFVTDQPQGMADRVSSAAAFGAQFPRTIDAIVATGADVLLFKTSPTLHEPMTQGYLRHADSFEPSVAQHRQRSAASATLIDRAATNPRVKVFDVADYLCDQNCKQCNQTCQAIYRDVVMYRDDNHLTTNGCQLFRPQLHALLAPSPANP